MEKPDIAAWAEGLEFERISTVRKVLKAGLVNPLANFAPAGLLKGLLSITKSELAAANWKDPGGWRSMVISYDGRPTQIADKVLVNAGTMSMALRNRRKLAARMLCGLIDSCPSEPVHVLCLGAGPGHIISDAMAQAKRNSVATLVDLSSDAFDYGRQLAQRMGLDQRMRFVQGDVRDVAGMLDRRVDLVKMMGICEYLPDEIVVSIAKAVYGVMPAGSAVVFNTLTPAHGTDRFFRRVFGLHMIHRSADALQALMAQAGFGEFQGVAEPLGVYEVMVARKPVQ